MGLGGIGAWELMLILVIVLILFGAGRLPQVFGQFGTAIKAFRDAQKDEPTDVTPDGKPKGQLADMAEADELDLKKAAEKQHSNVR